MELRIAALYDVHGNLPALEAVLADVEREHPELAGVEEHVVVCGHTHLQDDEVRAGHRVVNPGSVGHPTDRATAWWAMLGPDVELRTSDYDTAAAAAAMRERGFPLQVFADELLEPVTRARVLEKLREYA